MIGAMNVTAAYEHGLMVALPLLRNRSLLPSGESQQGSRSDIAMPLSNNIHCITRLSRDGFSWWVNICDYPAEMRSCKVSGLNCRESDPYHLRVWQIKPNSNVADDILVIEAVVCRLVDNTAFHPDGFDEEGDFKCVGG